MWSGGDHDGAGDLVALPSGRAFVAVAAPDHPRITHRLSAALARVLDRFAAGAGFDGRRRVAIEFRPGTLGHHRVGRAADIYAVAGCGVDDWKRAWDAAPDRTAQRRRNLGWRLHRALRSYGRWSQPYGYPIQLFGPWTREDGPWSHISDGLLQAHADHIHVAK